jgi:hypothetical protein
MTTKNDQNEITGILQLVKDTKFIDWQQAKLFFFNN